MKGRFDGVIRTVVGAGKVGLVEVGLLVGHITLLRGTAILLGGVRVFVRGLRGLVGGCEFF